MLRSRVIAARGLHTTSSSLRSIKNTPSAVTAKATISPSTQSASLASGVLLGTQRNWKSENVTTLKSELKRRGLSQQGNKGTLVSRLQSAEASSSLLPSAPAVTPQSPRVRNVSSSPVTKAATPPVRQPVPTAPMRMATPASESLPTSVPGKVATTSGDLDVETPVLAEPAPVTQQVRVSAPGIPIKPNTIPQSFLAINFPDPTPQEEIAQVIPTMPDNFSVKTDKSEKTQKSTEPKVMTVASAATHPAGGPHSPVTSVTDSHASEVGEDNAKLEESIDQISNAVNTVASATEKLYATLPSFPSLPKGKTNNYVVNTEPLTESERHGAWYLLAGLVTVVAVGRIFAPRPAKSHAEVKEE